MTRDLVKPIQRRELMFFGCAVKKGNCLQKTGYVEGGGGEEEGGKKGQKGVDRISQDN